MHQNQVLNYLMTSSPQVYICGGFNGSEILQDCECYSPETNQWTVITPMNTVRSGSGVIAYANHVYAVSM